MLTATAAVFLATRLIALDRWPIYFFTDEARNTVQAAQLLHNDFRDADGVFLPTYFQNSAYYSLSTSVYAQVIPYALFGFSVFVTRAVVVFITLSGTLAIGLILKDTFKQRFWWIGVLTLSITPAWFLHTRTAFENPLWVSFYAWFVYFYLRYRSDKPRHLLTALVFGALSFYSYNGGQLGIVFTGLLLLISDARYHWRIWQTQRRLIIAAMILLMVLVIPYLRFLIQYPSEPAKHLRILDSYWTQPLSLGGKLGRFIQEYWNGLRPDYWFSPNNGRDLIRHQLKGYGNLLLIAAPFAMIGLLITLKKFRSSSQRALLITLLVAPIGGALVTTNVLRDLVMVVPAALLTSIGLIAVLDRLARQTHYRQVAVGVFAVLSAINIYMLYDATTNGATWYGDYGLSGLQYGGQQVFEQVRADLASAPKVDVWIAATWLNGPDAIKDFFLPDEPRAEFFDLNAIMREKYTIDGLLLVLTREDYQRVTDSRKFTINSIEHVLLRPDDTPGFYFVRMSYSPQADTIFAAEREARSRLIADSLILTGQTVTVAHTPFDSGPLTNLFDGDSRTLVRTRETNPAVIEIAFPEPHAVSGLSVTTGSMNIGLTVEVYVGDGVQPGRYTGIYTDLPPDPTVALDFGMTIRATKLHIEIKNLNGDNYTSVHLREIKFK